MFAMGIPKVANNKHLQVALLLMIFHDCPKPKKHPFFSANHWLVDRSSDGSSKKSCPDFRETLIGDRSRP